MDDNRQCVPDLCLLPFALCLYAVLVSIDRAGVPAIVVALFFRDPDRTSPTGENLVLSPADGKVMFAGEGRQGETPPGVWRQVTIFLSPLDVHINRVPASGKVTRV